MANAMIQDFKIIPEWTSAEHGPEELRKTSARLQIICADQIATRSQDEWSQSVQNVVHLSAYPLAQWFAASWWRLRWEPASEGLGPVSWRMSHEMSAAGFGYLWPLLRFEPDGEAVDIICHPSAEGGKEPIVYLNTFRKTIPGTMFERAIDAFINQVLARLDAVGLRETSLHAIWRDIQEERLNQQFAAYRKIEALLGFDPDEAPEPLVAHLLSMAQQAGDAAMAEIAPVCAGEHPERTLQEIITLAETASVDGRIEKPIPLVADQVAKLPMHRQARPWERGWALARQARQAWSLQSGPISDKTLSDILAIPARVLGEPRQHNRPPLSLAVRQDEEGKVKLAFRRGTHLGRRFETARLLADFLSAPSEDRWLPATDSKTARQKIQRAFAAEFLCPIEALREYLADDFSTEAMDEAGEHFQVSPLAVKSHLANNQLISPDTVAA